MLEMLKVHLDMLPYKQKILHIHSQKHHMLKIQTTQQIHTLQIQGSLQHAF